MLVKFLLQGDMVLSVHALRSDGICACSLPQLIGTENLKVFHGVTPLSVVIITDET